MGSNIERSNVNGTSNHFIHSLPSSPPEMMEELSRVHPQNRSQPPQVSSSNAYRFSQISPSNRSYGGVEELKAYPPVDPSHLSNRHSMSHQIGPNGFRRAYSDNRASWLPSQPSSQTFIAKEQKRATLQSHANLANAKPRTNPNRASRLPEMPRRPSVEPSNLIHSFPDYPSSTRPKSVQADPRRVVTGILQSGLPPSARPPPVEMELPRSMPIAELEKRHKAALQKLQTYTNQRAAMNSIPSQPRHDDPQQRPPPQQRPTQQRSTQQRSTQQRSTQQRSTHQRPTPQQESTPQQRPTSQTRHESSSDASSKADKADQAVKTIGKSASISSRRSFFGFLKIKEESKPSKAVEEPIKPQKLSPKKKHRKTPQATDERGEEEDEDVPLAQLRDRRASYNPESPMKPIKQSQDINPLHNHTLTKSFSVPTNVNKLGDGEKLHMDYDAMDDSRQAYVKDHPTGKQSALPSGVNLPPGLDRPTTWLHANFDLSDEKFGPRPLIFAEEAKAIRNSKRFWGQ